MKLGGEREISDELNQISKEIIGAAIEVHRHLGPGLLESISLRIYEKIMTNTGNMLLIVWLLH